MTTLKLHYDGWLTLPAGLRDRLGLKTGDYLQAELVDGAIVLRPTHGKRVAAEPEPAAGMPVGATAAAADAVAAPVRRPRGRPRKVQADPSQAELLPGLEVLAPPRRKPGRPRKVHVEGAGRMPEPEPQPLTTEVAVWKLRPKAELQAAKPDPAPLPLPPRRREPSWTGSGYEREERRPFRNVEVRKLGPRRRHNER